MLPPQNNKYLFIDMNAFFASCEQQSHADYGHKPLAVTPVNTDNGCIISASYEAKAYGVKTGHLVKEAKKICPQLIICQSNVQLYLSFHQKLTQILEDFSPFLAIKSIDEAAIRLSPQERNSSLSRRLAQQIKEKIWQKMGQYLRCSIGIGPNVWISKMAAESNKPDGLVELKIADLPQFYQSLQLTDLKGINERMKIRLNRMGIFRPLDLFLASPQNLREKMGIMGDYWRLRMHGYDLDSSLIEQDNKSIGQSHVLEPRYRNWPDAWSICQKLAQRAGRRLREQGLLAQKIMLYIKYLGADSFHKTLKTDSFSDNLTFGQNMQILWGQAPKLQQPLKIAIALSNLSRPWGYQQTIFTQRQKSKDLYQLIDKINSRYGPFTIKPANVLKVDSAAPPRISFGQPEF